MYWVPWTEYILEEKTTLKSWDAHYEGQQLGMLVGKVKRP
jgi:hypothetical protein